MGLVGWVERSEAHAVKKPRSRVGLALLDPPYVSPIHISALTSTTKHALRT